MMGKVTIRAQQEEQQQEEEKHHVRTTITLATTNNFPSYRNKRQPPPKKYPNQYHARPSGVATTTATAQRKRVRSKKSLVWFLEQQPTTSRAQAHFYESKTSSTWSWWLWRRTLWLRLWWRMIMVQQRQSLVVLFCIMMCIYFFMGMVVSLWQQQQLGPTQSNIQEMLSSSSSSSQTLSFKNAAVQTLLPSLAEGRKERFPSIEERVRIYMGEWYFPPCNEQDKVLYRYNDANTPTLSSASATIAQGNQSTTTSKTTTVTLLRPWNNSSTAAATKISSSIPTIIAEVSSDPASRHLFFATQGDFAKGVADCRQRFARDKRIQRECLDVQSSIPATLLYQNHHHNGTTNPPILLRFGDRSARQAMPTFQQWRPVNRPNNKNINTDDDDDAATRTTITSPISNASSSLCQSWPEQDDNRKIPRLFPPIVWRLNTARHFGAIYTLAQHDVPWSEKCNKAVFRGALSGFGHDNDGFEDENDKQQSKQQGPNNSNLSESEERIQQCHRYPRCQLALLYHNSSLVDAKLTSILKNRIHNSGMINGIRVLGSKMSLPQLLQHKMLIFLEGNDLSSGLKWGLLSRSVVLMPPPTKIGWAMEELLQPYVHYVPLWSNLSNVEQQVQWVLDHDEQAQEIAHKGSLWIQDLVLHPQAASDDEVIFQSLLHRYAMHFRPADAPAE
ncbi:hypothetical protein ACA910_016168 [Epithemia clementina (nom. ined.)]